MDANWCWAAEVDESETWMSDHSRGEHLHGVFPHLGHLVSYFAKAAFSRSMLRTFAREATQAITSANSSSKAVVLFSFRASPSSFTSSTSQL